jgi:hypothetical protein
MILFALKGEDNFIRIQSPDGTLSSFPNRKMYDYVSYACYNYAKNIDELLKFIAYFREREEHNLIIFIHKKYYDPNFNGIFGNSTENYFGIDLVTGLQVDRQCVEYTLCSY